MGVGGWTDVAGVSDGWTDGGFVGGGASVAGTESVAVASTIAVIVAVSPGTGDGMMIEVAVAVGTGRVGVRLGSAASVLDAAADSMLCASLLDIKLVIATYKPSTMTSSTTRKPREYPLFIEQPRSVFDRTCYTRCPVQDLGSSGRIILEKPEDGKRSSSSGLRS